MQYKLSRNLWWKLRTYYDHLDDDYSYAELEHVDVWKEHIKNEFKAEYTEGIEDPNKWGTMEFEKEEFQTWFLLKMSMIKYED